MWYRQELKAQLLNSVGTIFVGPRFLCLGSTNVYLESRELGPIWTVGRFTRTPFPELWSYEGKCLGIDPADAWRLLVTNYC